MAVKSIIIHRKWDDSFDVIKQYFNVPRGVDKERDEAMVSALIFWDPWQRVECKPANG